MKIIAFIIVYNEEEVVEKCIKNAWEQGLCVIVIDNGCTDGTLDIVRKLDVPIFEYKTIKYNVFELNKFAISKARQVGCDWYVLKDADEIFSTYEGLRVSVLVKAANSFGYNCVRFDTYEFWPTVDDDLAIQDFTDRIQYYSYFGSQHLKMIKNSPEIYTDNPHAPVGIIRECPSRLILKHYKFISLDQGRRKVKARLSRYDTTRGFHMQYNKFTDESKFYVLEKDVYSKLYKFDGTLIKKKVFDGWRGY